MTAKRSIPEDFKIVSSKGAVDVSSYMMAVNCGLFRRNRFPEKRYEAYTPAPDDVLKTFVECVYGLAIDRDSIKQHVTPENQPYLMLLAEEFDCAPLREMIEEMRHEKGEQTRANIERLAKAIAEEECEVCAELERVLANDADESLKHLKEIPLSRIPLPVLTRIVEKAVEANRGAHVDRLLCDLILSKLESEGGGDVCALVNFLHIDRLSWSQVERLLSNEKMDACVCGNFPARFLKEMIAAVDSRVNDRVSELRAQFEAEVRQKIASLQAENEELRRHIAEDAERPKREIDRSIDKVQAEVVEEMIAAVERRVNNRVSKLEARLTVFEAELAGLNQAMDALPYFEEYPPYSTTGLRMSEDKS